MHSSTALAVETAQARRDRTASGHQQDLLELALDELLRHPDRGGDPDDLLSKALANSRKHLRRRRAIASITPYGDAHDLATLSDAGIADVTPAVIDAVDWLQRAPLTKSDRIALIDAAIATFTPGTGKLSTAAQQRLSRARASARAARTGFAW